MPLPTALGKVVGKPWAAWVTLASGGPSPDPTSTHSRRLNRSEISTFGSLPASERLTLVPCSYCGDKFKSTAIPEHVRLRHGGAKKPPKMISPDKKKSPTKKGKHGRFIKEKPTIIEPVIPAEPNSKTEEWVKNLGEVEENHRNEREIPVTSVVNQFMLKSASVEVKEPPKTSKESKVKLRKSKLPEPSLPVVDIPVEKSPQKREIPPVLELSPGPSKKSDVLPKKAKLEVPESPECDKSSEDVPEKITDVRAEVRKKKGKSAMRGGRVYDPDIHCGVVSKENARPCTRSLICKLHSITLRKAVKGRTKPFDTLISALQREKEIERNKVLDVEIVNTLINPAGVKLRPELLEVEVKPRSPKDVKPTQNDSPKLSLPVSIKNPNLWSQLSRKPPLTDAKPLNVGLLKKSVKKPTDKPRFPIIPRTVSVNGVRRDRDLPFEGFLLPGYRRSSGLLTTSMSVPRMNSKDSKKLGGANPLEKSLRHNYLLYLNSNFKDPMDHSDKSYDFLKLPDKNVIASMPSVTAQVNPLKHPGARPDSNTVTKSLNLFGPINGTAVLPLSMGPRKVENGPKVDSGAAGLLCEDVVRLESPRTHFFTPSGPLSVGVDRSMASSVCKTPKVFLPNSSLSASTSGIVYIQRTLKTAY